MELVVGLVVGGLEGGESGVVVEVGAGSGDGDGLMESVEAATVDGVGEERERSDAAGGGERDDSGDGVGAVEDRTGLAEDFYTRDSI